MKKYLNSNEFFPLLVEKKQENYVGINKIKSRYWKQFSIFSISLQEKKYEGEGMKYFTGGEKNKSCAEYTPLPIHSDEKPFSCEMCDYVCKRKKDLNRHMISHIPK